MEIVKIQNKIYEIRGKKVMLDFDLARLYEVETRVLKQAVRRNSDHFPDDFKFQITKKEWQEVITSCDNLPEKVKFSPTPPFVFTEQGVAILSSVLRSKKAIQMNIAIMRAFVFIRKYALSHKDLTEKLRLIEDKNDKKFPDVYEALKYLLDKDKIIVEQKNRARTGLVGIKKNCDNNENSKTTK